MIRPTALLFILSSLIINNAIAIRWCCGGSASSGTTGTGNVYFVECPLTANTECASSTNNGTTTYIGCTTQSTCSSVSCCPTEACNCPPNVHKTLPQIEEIAEEMRSIMYPLLGMVVAIGWIVAAIFMPKLPLKLVMFVIAGIDCFFGILLILLPTTVYIGLYFAALGAFILAVILHTQGNRFGLLSICALSFLGFIIVGGIMSLWSTGNPTIEDLYNSIPGCEVSMNIQNLQNLYYQINTRCENWLLFTIFSAFILFLNQPLAVMAVFFMMSRGGAGAGAEAGAGAGAEAGAGGGDLENTTPKSDTNDTNIPMSDSQPQERYSQPQEPNSTS